MSEVCSMPLCYNSFLFPYVCISKYIYIYQSADDSSDSPNIKIGCRDFCCNVINSVTTLTKGKENEKLIIQLINQIQNPDLQKEYLNKFKKSLLKDETSKKLKSTIIFEETLERFNKKKPKDLFMIPPLFYPRVMLIRFCTYNNFM